jgi:hypothetical protein
MLVDAGGHAILEGRRGSPYARLSAIEVFAHCAAQNAPGHKTGEHGEITTSP